MATFLGSKTFSFCKGRFTPQRVRTRGQHCIAHISVSYWPSPHTHPPSWRGTQPQCWFISSELYSAPSPPSQAVWGCSLEPSWVYLPPAASHNLIAPLPTSRVLHHAAGACSAICQHHLPDLLSQDYLLPNPHHFYQGFKACKQGVTIWKEGLKESEAAVLPPSIFSFSFQHTNIILIVR